MTSDKSALALYRGPSLDWRLFQNGPSPIRPNFAVDGHGCSRVAVTNQESMIGAQDMVRGGSGNRRRSGVGTALSAAYPLSFGPGPTVRRQWLNTIDAVLHGPMGQSHPSVATDRLVTAMTRAEEVHDATEVEVSQTHASDLAGGAHPSEALSGSRSCTNPPPDLDRRTGRIRQDHTRCEKVT